MKDTGKDPYLNILKLPKLPHDWEEPIIIDDPDLLEWATFMSKIWKKRYEKLHPKTHWKKGEKTNFFTGLLGQKLFELILAENEIPFIPNAPIEEKFRKTKPYDFRIHGFGTIEVKTLRSRDNYLLVKVSEWKHEDYVVAFKIIDKEQIQFIGWLHGKEVDQLPISLEGEWLTPYADAYKCEIKDLHTPTQFINMLLEHKLT